MKVDQGKYATSYDVQIEGKTYRRTDWNDGKKEYARVDGKVSYIKAEAAKSMIDAAINAAM